MSATTSKTEANGLNTPPARTRKGARPSRAAAEAAVRTLIAWSGDDPDREGLRDTPARVVESYEEYFSGYDEDPEAYLERCFTDVGGYDDMVMLRDIIVEAHCEHHMAPFLGSAHLAYIPRERFVGLSKLARVVRAYSHRLQTQETLTAQIHNAIAKKLEPKGVIVLVEAKHHCMTTRGVRHPNVVTVTAQRSGAFRDEAHLEERFMRMIRSYQKI